MRTRGRGWTFDRAGMAGRSGLSWLNAQAGAAVLLLALAAMGPLMAADGAELGDLKPLEQRALLLERFREDGSEAIPLLTSALDAEAPFVRRTAAHLLNRLGGVAREGIEKALENPDFQVRRIALAGVVEQGWLPQYWDQILEDEHASIQRDIRELRWVEVAEFSLPADDWRFKTDPEDVGRDQGWYAVDYDDGDWRDDVRIEASWQQFFEEPYIGVAWYRREVDVPDFPEGDTIYMEFGGVDESAWVWVNGEFAGEHDIGPSGWDVIFRLDVTDLIKPGESNLIVVRAMNTAAQGGIWRPVVLRVVADAK